MQDKYEHNDDHKFRIRFGEKNIEEMSFLFMFMQQCFCKTLQEYALSLNGQADQEIIIRSHIANLENTIKNSYSDTGHINAEQQAASTALEIIRSMVP